MITNQDQYKNDPGEQKYCDSCDTELTLISNLKRNIHVRGKGYIVKYERQYKCPGCNSRTSTTESGETWNPCDKIS